MTKNIAVIGANGGMNYIFIRDTFSLSLAGLGTALVNALQSSGYHVRGIVRESSLIKAQELFPNIEIYTSNPDNLVHAFQGMDIVIEVVSNSLRPDGIRDYLKAAEDANISTFIVCGGAFGLFINDEHTLRVIDVVEGSENYRAMNDMHLAVQVSKGLTLTLLTTYRLWPLRAKFLWYFKFVHHTCH